jgi:hypothetical protein
MVDSKKVDLPLERLRLFPQLFAPTHRASYRSLYLSPTLLHFVFVVCFGMDNVKCDIFKGQVPRGN